MSTKEPTIIKRKEKRKNKDGSITIWESNDYYYVYYINRKKHFLNTHKSNYDEALAKVKKLIVEMKAEDLLSFLEANHWFSATDNPLFVHSNNESYDYKYQYGQSKRNARYLEILFYDIEDPIAELPYNQITPKDVIQFKDRLANVKSYTDKKGNERKATPTLRNRILDSLSTIYSYYVNRNEYDISSNPFLSIKRFKIKKPTERYVFTGKDISRLFNKESLLGIKPRITYIDAHGEEVPLTKQKWDALIESVYFSIFKFICYTGLRVSEASALQVEQFNTHYQNHVLKVDRAFKSEITTTVEMLNTGIKLVGETKTGMERTIVLCDEAYQTVEPYLRNKKPKDYVFTKDNSDYSKHNAFTKREYDAKFRIFMDALVDYYDLRKNVEANKVFTLHGFRTSLNTNLLSADKLGLTESLVAYYLGWNSKMLQKTQRVNYTKFLQTSTLPVANAINILYSGKPIEWKPLADETIELAHENIFRSTLPDTDKNELTSNRYLELLNEMSSILQSGFLYKEFNDALEIFSFEDEYSYGYCKRIVDEYLKKDKTKENFYKFISDDAIRIFITLKDNKQIQNGIRRIKSVWNAE